MAARLPAPLRRQLAHVYVWLRERPRVTGSSTRLVPDDGRWSWVRDHPRLARSDLRIAHLTQVHSSLQAAGVPSFLVIDPTDRQHQLGVLEEHWAAALAAASSGLRGQGWYAASGRRRWLIDRLPAGHAEAVDLYPCYRLGDGQRVVGRELGVPIVPWHRREATYVPNRPNPQAAALREADLGVVEVERHARAWPVPRALATPHADEVAPLRWVIHVPARLRHDAPEVADLLGRAAARSVWFHGPPGADVVLLDGARPAWCSGHDAPQVRLHAEETDEVGALARVWKEAERPLAVVPAGGLLLRDLAAQSVMSPGGVGGFDIDADWIDDPPEGLVTTSVEEAHCLAAWFERRTGERMRWRVSRAPYALPMLDDAAREELDDLLGDPARPRVRDAASAALPAVWWAHRRGAALPGPLTVARLTPGASRYRRALSRLSAGEGQAVAASVDVDRLLDAPAERQHLEDLFGRRLPLAAPWELDVASGTSREQE